MESKAQTNQSSVSKRGSLSHTAYERIKSDIMEQRLMPRQQLVESELAAEYGMSKTPVREALMALSREGLIELSSFRGGRVRDFTAEQARHIYELRELLEPFALERAVPRMHEEDLQRLRSIIEEAAELAKRGNQRQLSKLGREFHEALVARCDNVRVVELLAELQDQIRIISLRLWTLRATYERELKEHKAILKAVEARNAAKAASLLRQHITEFKKQYVAEWEQ